MAENKHKKLGTPHPVDEAWWMLILEEAEAQNDAKPQPEAKRQPQPFQESRPSLNHESTPQLGDLDWEWAQQLYIQDEVVELEVTGYNRGGILVEGPKLQGFVPLSHLIQLSSSYEAEDSLKNVLDTYIDKKLQLKVLECNPSRGRVIFSERAAQANPGRRIQLLDDLKEGDRIQGYITTVTDFGAFVDMGGMEGLIHISELSWGRVDHPNKVVSEGDEVEVCVLQIDRQRTRVALSLKRLHANPWESVKSIHQPGQVTDATITSVVAFGAFARLESGLDGLIHVSEMGLARCNGTRPEDILREGQRIQVRILHIDPHRQRLGLRLQEIYDNAEAAAITDK